ncbi:adenosine deaminase/aminodeoxyfutalosine deaminase [Nakamurella sp. UYEF19]|uniref:adenosine deaminase n=1 Tax=Nakamurella sp. UYEF19 TaxID=1756392 RepID=UPI003396C6C2
MNLHDYIAGLPKAELHVHHVGSASPTTVAALAARYEGRTAVPADPGLLADYFTFTDFAHFIDVYLSVVDLIRDAQDVHQLTYAVAADLAAQQVRYAELTVTPFTSVRAGIPAEEFCDAIEDARLRAERDFGIVMRWIFDIPGEAGIPAADATLDIALRCRPQGLVGFGLGGPEVGVPRPQFAAHFASARASGLHSVPHAGESTGPSTIWDAIETLGAERIGHGIAAARDDVLMALLKEREIALEVCPTSNVRTRSVASLEEHPLPLLFAAGVPLTVNSDDPSMFSTTLCREYEIAAELLHLDEDGVTALAAAAVRHSFADAADLARITSEQIEYRDLAVRNPRAAPTIGDNRGIFDN